MASSGLFKANAYHSGPEYKYRLSSDVNIKSSLYSRSEWIVSGRELAVFPLVSPRPQVRCLKVSPCLFLLPLSAGHRQQAKRLKYRLSNHAVYCTASYPPFLPLRIYGSLWFGLFRMNTHGCVNGPPGLRLTTFLPVQPARPFPETSPCRAYSSAADAGSSRLSQWGRGLVVCRFCCSSGQRRRRGRGLGAGQALSLIHI